MLTDQLRKLSTNVEGISLAGGTPDALSTGTDSAIVLRVVRSRARVNKGEKDEKWEKKCARCVIRYLGNEGSRIRVRWTP
jgi:hypothetical protein